jgi:hypothetical protein
MAKTRSEKCIRAVFSSRQWTDVCIFAGFLSYVYPSTPHRGAKVASIRGNGVGVIVKMGYGASSHRGHILTSIFWKSFLF